MNENEGEDTRAAVAVGSDTLRIVARVEEYSTPSGSSSDEIRDSAHQDQQQSQQSNSTASSEGLVARRLANALTAPLVGISTDTEIPNSPKYTMSPVKKRSKKLSATEEAEATEVKEASSLASSANTDTTNYVAGVEVYSAPTASLFDEIRDTSHQDLEQQYQQSITVVPLSGALANTSVHNHLFIVSITLLTTEALMTESADTSIGILIRLLLSVEARTSEPISGVTQEIIDEIIMLIYRTLKAQLLAATSAVTSLRTLTGTPEWSISKVTTEGTTEMAPVLKMDPEMNLAQNSATAEIMVDTSRAFINSWVLDVETLFLELIATATSEMAAREIAVLTLSALSRQFMAPTMGWSPLSYWVDVLPGAWVEIKVIEEQEETEFEFMVSELLIMLSETSDVISSSSSSSSSSCSSLSDTGQLEMEQLQRVELERMGLQIQPAEE